MESVLAEIEDIDIALDSIADDRTLIAVRQRLDELLDKLDDRLDLRMIEERKDEPTISHHQVTLELRNDGLI